MTRLLEEWDVQAEQWTCRVVCPPGLPMHPVRVVGDPRYYAYLCKEDVEGTLSPLYGVLPFVEITRDAGERVEIAGGLSFATSSEPVALLGLGDQFVIQVLTRDRRDLEARFRHVAAPWLDPIECASCGAGLNPLQLAGHLDHAHSVPQLGLPAIYSAYEKVVPQMDEVCDLYADAEEEWVRIGLKGSKAFAEDGLRQLRSLAE